MEVFKMSRTAEQWSLCEGDRSTTLRLIQIYFSFISVNDLAASTIVFMEKKTVRKVLLLYITSKICPDWEVKINAEDGSLA